MSNAKKSQAPGPTEPALSEAENFVTRATGSDDKDWQSHLLDQTEASFRRLYGETEPEQVNARKAELAVLEGIAPRDPVEAMLAAQMVATHNAAMEFTARTIDPDQTMVRSEAAGKHAAKFLDLYRRQMETLDKHRGKGRQKIRVEYVNVEAGGQAIVGNVETSSKEATKVTRPAALEHSADPVMPPLTEQSAAKKLSANRKELRYDE